MEIQKNPLTKEQEIIKTLFKDLLSVYNSRSVSKEVGITHAGAFKILKRLEKRGIVIARPIGKAITYTLNFANPIAHKEIEMALLLEAQQYQQWLYEFRKLEGKVEFAILFGSVLIDERKARDIDFLVVAKKENFDEVRAIIKKISEVRSKKIHLIPQSPEDFEHDITNKNKAMMEIIKKGIVLFGHENIWRYLIR